MKLEEWIAFYERKTDDKFSLKDGYTLIWTPEKGFMQISYNKEREMLLVFRLCGDIQAWHFAIDAIAQLVGCHKASTIVIRHIKPWIRLNGGRITREKDGPYGKLYEGTLGEGKNFTCCPLDGGNYICVWEV